MYNNLLMILQCFQGIFSKYVFPVVIDVSAGNSGFSLEIDVYYRFVASKEKSRK